MSYPPSSVAERSPPKRAVEGSIPSEGVNLFCPSLCVSSLELDPVEVKFLLFTQAVFTYI